MKSFGYLALALALSATGCATIVTGTTQVVTVNSNVQGAQVMLDGNPIGVTPFSARLPKKSNQVLTVRKRGYQPQTIALQTSVPVAFWGNILFGGLPGSTTDAATGAINEYSPNSYYATLNRSGRRRAPSVDDDADDADDGASFVRERFALFALNNYPRLSRELAAGKGPLVAASCELLGAADDLSCSALVAVLSDRARRHEDPIAFVDSLKPTPVERIE